MNLITSKLYTTSLLSSLNSRQGWGYDTSEDNDGESNSMTDLGLRFACNSPSTLDGTSEVINTPLVSPLFLFFIITAYTYYQDFVPGELERTWLRKVEQSEGQLWR